MYWTRWVIICVFWANSKKTNKTNKNIWIKKKHWFQKGTGKRQLQTCKVMKISISPLVCIHLLCTTYTHFIFHITAEYLFWENLEYPLEVLKKKKEEKKKRTKSFTFYKNVFKARKKNSAVVFLLTQIVALTIRSSIRIIHPRSSPCSPARGTCTHFLKRKFEHKSRSQDWFPINIYTGKTGIH